jgi:hypothetical protein
MNTELLKPVLEWAAKHLSWRWVFAVCSTAAILLFLPHAYLVRFGLLEFNQKYKVWLSLTFLVTFIFLFTYPLALVQEMTMRSVHRVAGLNQRKERLHTLSVDEKVILRRFVHARGCVLNLDAQDGAVNVLRNDELIFAPLLGGRWHVGKLHSGFPYKIQPWVLKYLTKHPEYLS